MHSGAAECDWWTGEQRRGVRLVEKAMEGLWTVFLWFWGGVGGVRGDLLQLAFIIDADWLSPHQCIQIKQC